jgi:AraC-like DNA-binding protein
MTPYQYFIQLKISKAESLLENDISIKEAAYNLGFNDQFYFSRLFKNKTGVTPSEWKVMIRSPGGHHR